MVDYVLSEKAADDLSEIYAFTYSRFGEARADAYLLALEERFLALAERPQLGRRIDLREGYYRYTHASHVVFYTIVEDGVYIVRVLHSSMDIEQHL